MLGCLESNSCIFTLCDTFVFLPISIVSGPSPNQAHLQAQSPSESWARHQNTSKSKIIWVVVSNIFYFYPYLGKIPILTNVFGMGWNHQLVIRFWVGFAYVCAPCVGDPPKKASHPLLNSPRRTRQCPGSRSVTVVRCTTAAAPSPSVRSCKRRGSGRGSVVPAVAELQGWGMVFGSNVVGNLWSYMETSCYFWLPEIFFYCQKFQLHK